MSIDAKGLTFSYGGRDILKDISFHAEDGELVAVLGPNGAGKSTLFRCLLGFLPPKAGEISVNGKKIRTYSRRELSREIAYIPQSSSPAFNYTVLDAVLMGLSGQLGLFDHPDRQAEERAMSVLEEMGISHLAGSGIHKISGGERQLMLLCRALVQDARTLIMDEPTASLDYANSYRVMERVSALSGKGYTVIWSTHDPNQAFRWADRVLTLQNGTVLTDGTPEQALTDARLSSLYGLRVATGTVRAESRDYRVCLPLDREDYL